MMTESSQGPGLVGDHRIPTSSRESPVRLTQFDLPREQENVSRRALWLIQIHDDWDVCDCLESTMSDVLLYAE
jgi:hypothetical protein